MCFVEFIRSPKFRRVPEFSRTLSRGVPYAVGTLCRGTTVLNPKVFALAGLAEHAELIGDTRLGLDYIGQAIALARTDDGVRSNSNRYCSLLFQDGDLT